MEPFDAEEVACGVGRFGEAVGVEDERVVVGESGFGGAVKGVFKNEEAGASRSAREGEVFGGCQPATKSHGARVPGAAITDRARAEIDDEMARRGEDNLARLLQKRGEIAVQLREECARFGAARDRLADERANHRGDGTGAHAVAHHVADENADCGIRERQDVGGVAADGLRGFVNACESQAGRSRFVARAVREA